MNGPAGAARLAQSSRHSYAVVLPARAHPLNHRWVLGDDLRPAAVIALGRQLGSRVDADLAAPELLVRRMVEVVNRPDGREQIVRVVDVPERPPRDVRVVVDVAVSVDDHD